jgi:hypothetical protein
VLAEEEKPPRLIAALPNAQRRYGGGRLGPVSRGRLSIDSMLRVCHGLENRPGSGEFRIQSFLFFGLAYRDSFGGGSVDSGARKLASIFLPAPLLPSGEFGWGGIGRGGWLRCAYFQDQTKTLVVIQSRQATSPIRISSTPTMGSPAGAVKGRSLKAGVLRLCSGLC